VRVRKQALALASNGYEVDIVCLKFDDEIKNEVYQDLRIHRIAVKQKRAGIMRYIYEYTTFFLLAMIKLTKLHIKRRYNFIQVNTLPDFLVFATIIPKLFGAKVVLDLHEPAPELFESLFEVKKKFVIHLIQFFERISIKYADLAITVSEQMKANFVKRGAKASKIEVVLNVPNLEFSIDKNSYNFEKKTDKFLIICHGAMFKRYGQDVAIRAIAIVKEKVPNVRLNIVGYGNYEAELKKLTAILDLDNYVNFCGFLSTPDLITLIAQSDIGIVPVEKNAYSDLVHTNKMFEYIAMKTPVIISRTKAVTDFFGLNNSCLKFFQSGDEKDLANCILDLYLNPKRRQTMINNASKKFESIRWEISKHNYCEIYEKLL
jgi:glycosyltransferase involved in cell wall biosynthesis